VNEERLIQLFKDLVLINAPALEERAVVDYVKKILIEMGLEVREDKAGEKIGGNAGNLIAKLPANRPGLPSIFLSAHFDTVEPTEGLELVERDGVISSGGKTILGADDKGGMAPAIEAVRMIQDSGEPHGDIALVFTVAEEIGLKGADALELQELDVDFGFVLDTGPPVGTFVTRTATHDKLDITVRGVPAHAGKDPEKGISAIQVMADAVSQMKLGRIGPETTANIGVIEGGTAVNVVCPFVHLWAEARSTSIAELDAQVQHMIETFEAAAQKWNTTVEITHDRHYVSYELSEDLPVVKVAVQASKNLGFEPTLRTTLGGSDANVFNAKGVPTIVVATGMDKIHTHEEFIKIEDLIATTRLTYEILLETGKVSC
jgi:tripeptide aminopeptidase